jgi:hypothetical protein
MGFGASGALVTGRLTIEVYGKVQGAIRASREVL